MPEQKCESRKVQVKMSPTQVLISNFWSRRTKMRRFFDLLLLMLVVKLTSRCLVILLVLLKFSKKSSPVA